MNIDFTPASPLEEKLLAMYQGELDEMSFMQELLQTELFMPIYDKHSIGGLQTSDKAEPLTLSTEDGQKVLILFTTPERGKEFLTHYPDYKGGLLAEVEWILERLGSGIGISINPDSETGFDLEPEMVEQMIASILARKQNSPTPTALN